MIFYVAAIDHATEGSVAYARLDDAKRDCDPGGEVVKIVTPDRITRELLCAIYNREGFAVSHTEVYRKPREKGAEE